MSRKKYTFTNSKCGSVMNQKSLYFVCHSGLDEPAPYLIRGGNDGSEINAKKPQIHYTNRALSNTTLPLCHFTKMRFLKKPRNL